MVAIIQPAYYVPHSQHIKNLTEQGTPGPTDSNPNNQLKRKYLPFLWSIQLMLYGTAK